MVLILVLETGVDSGNDEWSQTPEENCTLMSVAGYVLARRCSGTVGDRKTRARLCSGQMSRTMQRARVDFQRRWHLVSWGLSLLTEFHVGCDRCWWKFCCSCSETEWRILFLLSEFYQFCIIRCVWKKFPNFLITIYF
jgi:hypothetical protein